MFFSRLPEAPKNPFLFSCRHLQIQRIKVNSPHPLPLIQPHLVSDHRDELAVGRLSSQIVDGIAEVAVQGTMYSLIRQLFDNNLHLWFIFALPCPAGLGAINQLIFLLYLSVWTWSICCFSIIPFSTIQRNISIQIVDFSSWTCTFKRYPRRFHHRGSIVHPAVLSFCFVLRQVCIRLLKENI